MNINDEVYLKGVVINIKEKKGQTITTVEVEGKKIDIEDIDKILFDQKAVVDSATESLVILNEYTDNERAVIFDSDDVSEIISNNTTEDIKKTIEEYNKKDKIKDGDIVVDKDGVEYLVTLVFGSNCYCLNLETFVPYGLPLIDLTKTNKNHNLKKIFKD